MKERIRRLDKKGKGIILGLVLAVPLILFAISAGNIPTIFYDGMRINVMPDGSVQMLVDVGVGYTEWVSDLKFELNYNENYFVPSDYDTNEPITPASMSGQGGVKPEDVAKTFRYNPDLYREDRDHDGVFETPVNPFKSYEDMTLKEQEDSNQSITKDCLSMLLLLNNEVIDEQYVTGDMDNPVDGEMAIILRAENSERIPVVCAKNSKVVFGTLSFRVTDPSKLPEIAEKFERVKNDLDPYAQGNTNDYLIHFKTKGTTFREGPWRIDSWVRASGSEDYQTRALNDWPRAPAGFKAEARFTFHFPRTIISVEAAEMELSIDAYRAYTEGNVGDLDKVLQKYSPTVIVKYSDGTQGSFMMPWGRVTAPWTASDYYYFGGRDEDTGEFIKGAPVTNYDPTGGDYYVEKLFCYEDEDQVMQVFPVPVKVHLTVTPIKLLDVTADNLHKAYVLNNALVDPNTGIQNHSALKLPSEARLIVDIPPSGVSLTMDIHGWSHEQENGYWPFANVPAGEPEVLGLWKDGTVASDAGYLHWPVPNDRNQWKNTEANGSLLGNNRAGMYTFFMAETYGSGIKDIFTQQEIQAKYPWLTVDRDYDLENATREIVWNDAPVDPDDPQPPKLEDTARYVASYVSTETDPGNDQPTLTLQVTKKAEASGATANMNEFSAFRVKMPDGTEIGVGTMYSGTVHEVEATKEDWFAGNDGFHQQNQKGDLGEDGNRRGYHLLSNPGDPTTPDNDFNTERELLRRYINLGGWFYVAVKEGPDADGREYRWSDFIPVYVPPRPNYYTENKEYNFIGSNADLFPWPNGIQSTVILPQGEYEIVDDQGGLVYAKDEFDQIIPGVRQKERYGVKTTYDGITGAQPGELNTFAIFPDANDASTGPNGWKTDKTGSITVNGGVRSITKYGPNEFLDNRLYTAFGYVRNKWSLQPNPDNYTAVIRVEKEADPTPKEKELVTLTYVSTNGGTPSVTYSGVNVDTAIFNTKLQGYTTRQDYTLSINNIGDTDIYGLDINSLYSFTGDDGGHFEILQPPASFLPAGESTTFVLTYVYGLEAQKNGDPLDYLDRLYITSNSHNHLDPEDPDNLDYLLHFHARFQVTNTDIHRVTVRVIPADGGMGTAGVIMGELRGSTGMPPTMDTSPGSDAFGEGSTVYIMVTPKDEYNRYDTTVVDDSGANHYLYRYNTDNVTLPDGSPIPDGVEVWYFTMPDYDTVVTVTFREPIDSKLRLSDLIVYADEKSENLFDKATETQESWDARSAPYVQKIWQKSFTEAEENKADSFANDSSHKYTSADQYLMALGTADVPGFDKSVKHYLTVIPYDADFAQIEAKLLSTMKFDDLENPDLSPVTVDMTLYYKDKDSYTGADKVSYTEDDNDKDTVDLDTYKDRSVLHDINGDTAVPTRHTSSIFDSPPHGKSVYVRVDVSYTEGGITTTRSYYVELHRAPKDLVIDRDYGMNYGNSPFGMIMNDKAIADKDTAKVNFINNKYSFDGLTANVPAVVQGTDLQRIHYWTEAWVAPDAVYEPESGLGITHYVDYFGGRVQVGVGLYRPENNLDLSDYAFFAIMGEAFEDPGLSWIRDSSGRKVPVEDAVLSLDAITLDTAAGKQTQRFGLPTIPDPDDPTGGSYIVDTTGRTVIMDLGPAATTVNAFWSNPGNGRYLRPGRYKLVYSVPDYDHDPMDPDPHYLKVTRDFVVLAPVGDVDADRTVTEATDRPLVKGRVTDPLGYLAENYEGAAIFKLRTCDVNNDRNINNIDANAIAADGVTNPKSDYLEKIQKYYLPIGYK